MHQGRLDIIGWSIEGRSLSFPEILSHEFTIFPSAPKSKVFATSRLKFEFSEGKAIDSQTFMDHSPIQNERIS